MPHILQHGPTVYNGHLREPVTLTPVAEHFAVELSLPVLRLRSVANGDRVPISRMEGHRHRGGLVVLYMRENWGDCFILLSDNTISSVSTFNNT